MEDKGNELGAVLERRRLLVEGSPASWSASETSSAPSSSRWAGHSSGNGVAGRAASLTQNARLGSSPRTSPPRSQSGSFISRRRNLGNDHLYETESSKRLESEVNRLTVRNEQLNSELVRLKKVNDDGGLYVENHSEVLLGLNHSDVLLSQTDQLIALTDQARAWQQSIDLANGEQSAKSYQGLRSQSAPDIEFSPQLGQEVQVPTEALRKEIEELRKERAQMCKKNETLQQKCDTLSSELHRQQSAVRETQRVMDELEHERNEKMRLASDLQLAREEADRKSAEASILRDELDSFAASGSGKSDRLPVSSESKLRAVLTSRTATTGEMKEAIGAVDALVGEAKRELAQRQLRERRAAFEQLHLALDRSDEQLLVAALEVSRRAEVDAEDIEKAEAKLRELRELTDEQRSFKERRARESKNKKEAFLLVKKDDASTLATFLEALESDVRWQDWRDYAGRSMWRCAQELRAARVQKYLAPLMGMHVPEERLSSGSGHRAPEVAEGDSPVQTECLCARQNSSGSIGAKSPKLKALSPIHLDAVGDAISLELPSDDVCGSDVGLTPVGVAGIAQSACELRFFSEAEEADVRAKAFRAVAQDSASTLAELLEDMPLEAWSKWENKAGKDLVTLSQERGSSSAYTVLAKALGMLREQKRETFEESETVWVYLQGDVQPRRANVMENTSEDVEEVVVEYWDGDAPPERVPRDSICKMLSVN